MHLVPGDQLWDVRYPPHIWQTVNQLATGISWSVSPGSQSTGKIIVAFAAVFGFFYNGCVGAAPYPVATELVSSRLRAWTVGTAMSLGYILAWLVGFCTPYLINPEKLNWVSIVLYG